MLTSTSAGNGRIQSGENDLWLRPTRGALSKRGAIYCHQGGAQAFTPLNEGGTGDLIRAIGAVYPTASSDLGALNHWGNTTAQTRTGQMDSWVQSGAGASSADRIGIGISMGAAALINYASSNTGDFAAFVFVLPAWDIDALYQGNVGGSRAGIEAAWGITYPASLPAGANPKDNGSTLNGIPSRIYYASDDSICDGTRAASMASVIGGTTINLGALGHTEAAIAAIDKPALITWLRTVAAP